MSRSAQRTRIVQIADLVRVADAAAIAVDAVAVVVVTTVVDAVAIAADADAGRFLRVIKSSQRWLLFFL